MTTEEIRAKKRQLRKDYKEIRKSIPMAERIAKNDIIRNEIISSMSYKFCKTLLLFYSVNDEPDTVLLAEKALADGKNVYFPKCYNGGIMRFYKVTDLSELTEKCFNIPEPEESSEEFSSDSGAVLCIVPGVCFDKNGYRIGYGKGFYDRFLAKFKGITMGITFSECVSENNIPFEKRYDKAVDILVTEKEVLCIG